MTTLIDRIMKRIDELKKSTCTKSIVDELERVKAELTAVNGVDKLIEKRIKKCLRTILKTLDKDGMIRRSKIISQFDLLLSDLKSLKQTPVVSKPNKIIREWRIIDGKQVILEREIDQSIDDRLKDSQPKEVEIKYVIRKCVCKTTLGLSDNYCPNCGAKIKWIA